MFTQQAENIIPNAVGTTPLQLWLNKATRVWFFPFIEWLAEHVLVFVRALYYYCIVKGFMTLNFPHPCTNATTVMEAAVSQHLSESVPCKTQPWDSCWHTATYIHKAFSCLRPWSHSARLWICENIAIVHSNSRCNGGYTPILVLGSCKECIGWQLEWYESWWPQCWSHLWKDDQKLTKYWLVFYSSWKQVARGPHLSTFTKELQLSSIFDLVPRLPRQTWKECLHLVVVQNTEGDSQGVNYSILDNPQVLANHLEWERSSSCQNVHWVESDISSLFSLPFWCYLKWRWDGGYSNKEWWHVLCQKLLLKICDNVLVLCSY